MASTGLIFIDFNAIFISVFVSKNFGSNDSKAFCFCLKRKIFSIYISNDSPGLTILKFKFFLFFLFLIFCKF